MKQTILRVDPTRCTARGLCAELLPEMITLDVWGYPIIAGMGVPNSLLGHARRAVAACPTLALSLSYEEISQSTQRRPEPPRPPAPQPPPQPRSRR